MKSSQTLPFFYGVQVSLTSNGSGSGTITCQQDAPFELHYFMARSSLDFRQYDGTTFANVEFADTFTVMITEQTTGKQLMSQRTHQRVLCSPGNNSISERRPVEFPAGTVFTVELTNLIAAANVVDFYMKGYKLYSPLPSKR